MNIYEFISSTDIATHCTRINHSFTPVEMAVIIGWSNKTIKQKIAAWQEVIANYPDMSIPARNSVSAHKSLHEYLRIVIIGEEKKLADFYSPSLDTVYSAYDGEGKNTRIYTSTADEAWAAYHDYNDNKDSANYQINKHHIDAEEVGTAYVNNVGEPTDIYIEEGFRNELADIFINIPMPFAKGDIVELSGKPRVLESLPHWDVGGRFKYEDFVSGRIGDAFDMQAGLFYFDNNAITWEHHFYHNLCYFRGELSGCERFLKYLSLYLKNNDSPIALPWLLNAYNAANASEGFSEIDKRFIRKPLHPMEG